MAGVTKLDLIELRRLYVDEQLGTPEVASRVGVTAATVATHLRRMGVMRTRSEAANNMWRTSRCPVKMDNELLRRLYVDECKSGQEIADELGINRGVVHNRLSTMGVIRSCSDHLQVRHKGRVVPIDPDEIAKLYGEKKLSMQEIANRVGLSAAAIYNALRSKGVERRCHSEANVLRWKSRRYDLDIDLIRSMYLEDYTTLSEIAKHFGVSRIVIKSRIVEAGIPLRSEPEIRRLQIANSSREPNNSELAMFVMLEESAPGEFEYNGGCELGVVLGGRVPDFVNVNGKKQVVLLHGCYWHSCPSCGRGTGTIQAIELQDSLPYEQLGYDCLIVWEHELDDYAELKHKVRGFLGVSVDDYVVEDTRVS